MGGGGGGRRRLRCGVGSKGGSRAAGPSYKLGCRLLEGLRSLQANDGLFFEVWWLCVFADVMQTAYRRVSTQVGVQMQIKESTNFVWRRVQEESTSRRRTGGGGRVNEPAGK